MEHWNKANLQRGRPSGYAGCTEPGNVRKQVNNIHKDRGNVHGQRANKNDIAAADHQSINHALSLQGTPSLGQTTCNNGVERDVTTEMLEGPEDVGTPTVQRPVSPGNQIEEPGSETITAGFSGIKKATVECSPSEMITVDQGLDAKLKDSRDIGNILSNVINHQGENVKVERSPEEEDAQLGEGTRENEESEDEMVKKHTMNNPNLNSPITKVRHPKPVNVLGCLSCFTFFIPTGVSYKVVDVIKKLMEKLSWLDSSVDLRISFPEMRS